MNRARLLAELAAGKPGPDGVLSLERRGEEGRRPGEPGAMQAAPYPMRH